jgi:ATP-binding cassette, subfamily C, bacterial CydD
MTMSVQRDLMRQARISGLALFFNILSALLTAIAVILQALLLARVIDLVFLQKADLSAVALSLWQIGGLIVIRSILAVAGDVSAKLISLKVKSNLREILLNKITRLGPVYAAGEKRGETIHMVFEGIEALDAYFSQYLPQVILSGLIPFAILIAVFPRELISGLILLFTAPLIPLFMALIGIVSEQRTKKQWKMLTQLSTHFYDTLQGLELLKQLNQDKQQSERLATSDKSYRDATMQVLRYTFLSAMALELVATISTAIVAVEIGIRLLYGQISYQPAIFILILTPEFYLPLRQLGVKYHAAMSGIQSANTIFRFLAEPESGGDIQGAQQVYTQRTIDQPLSLFPLKFDQVSARYTDADRDVISNISFAIHQGEHLAIVGESGVGKTTLFNLLLRFLPLCGGDILAGDISFRVIPPADWLQQIAWVPQTPYIFNNSIRANIVLNNTKINEDLLSKAVRIAGLQEWVESLPQGLDTPTGERGKAISAGQAQRIAIARAVYKNAPFILLDEPTSLVDPILEKSLHIATQTLMADRTVLTIAHRLPTIYQSDRILLLEDGKLSEEGTHSELLARNGVYADLLRRYSHEAG